MERLLLTGSTGFIGKRLLDKLPRDKYEIHTIERYHTPRYSAHKTGEITRHTVNLTDYSAVKNVISEVRPDYVIHLAAISANVICYERYIESTEVNYVATMNLAEVCRREYPAIKQFIFAGSSEEYGLALQSTTKKLTEDTLPMPNTPYSIAKFASEKYLQYLNMAFKFPYTILRPFNTYGRTETKNFFIERTITQMLQSKEVTLGDKTTIRDWLYVDDHVDGYLKALGNENAINQVIQLSTGEGHTTEETAQIIAKLIGFDGEIKWNATYRRPSEPQMLIGDNSKAAKLISWKPRYTLEDGLGKTIPYWRKFLNVGS